MIKMRICLGTYPTAIALIIRNNIKKYWKKNFPKEQADIVFRGRGRRIFFDKRRKLYYRDLPLSLAKEVAVYFVRKNKERNRNVCI